MDIRKMLEQLDLPVGSSITGGLLPLNERLNYVRTQKPRLEVEPLVLDLGTARDNEVLVVQGDSLLVASISGSLSVRFNEPENPLHNLQVERNFSLFGNESGFYRLFLTNSAQSGKSATLVIGKDMAFRVEQGLPATKLTDSDGNDIDPLTQNVLSSPTHGKTDVGTTSTAIMAAQSDRNYALIINDSDTVVYLSLNGAAEVGKGIRLNPNGGAYEINQLNLHTGVINGIHGGTGTKSVSWLYSPGGA